MVLINLCTYGVVCSLEESFVVTAGVEFAVSLKIILVVWGVSVPVMYSERLQHFILETN